MMLVTTELHVLMWEVIKNIAIEKIKEMLQEDQGKEIETLDIVE